MIKPLFIIIEKSLLPSRLTPLTDPVLYVYMNNAGLLPWTNVNQLYVTSSQANHAWLLAVSVTRFPGIPVSSTLVFVIHTWSVVVAAPSPFLGSVYVLCRRLLVQMTPLSSPQWAAVASNYYLGQKTELSALTPYYWPVGWALGQITVNSCLGFTVILNRGVLKMYVTRLHIEGMY